MNDLYAYSLGGWQMSITEGNCFLHRSSKEGPRQLLHQLELASDKNLFASCFGLRLITKRGLFTKPELRGQGFRKLYNDHHHHHHHRLTFTWLVFSVQVFWGLAVAVGDRQLAKNWGFTSHHYFLLLVTWQTFHGRSNRAWEEIG